MEETIVRKLRLARRILRDGDEDCIKDLEELAGLPYIERKTKFLGNPRHGTQARALNILAKMGGYLYQAAKLFVEEDGSSAPFHFYFWPGYDSILQTDQASRITLQSVSVSGIKLIPCGISFSKASAEGRTALSSTSDWYNRVLAQHSDVLNGEEFTPGSTHYWVAKQNLRLPDGSKKGAPLNLLAVELDESPRESVSDSESGVLSVSLNYSDSSCWVEDVDKVLNDPAKIKSDFLWPLPSPPLEPFLVVDREQLEQRSDWSRRNWIRLRLYSIWFLACFRPQYDEQHWKWIEEFAEEIKDELPRLYGRIRDGLRAAKNNDLIQESPEYRNWYTLILERIPPLPAKNASEELGSAMILSSHKIPTVCLLLMQQRIEWIYLLMRSFEESILLEEEAQQRGMSAGQIAQANESAHEAGVQLSSVSKLLGSIKKERGSEITDHLRGSVAYAQLFLSPKPRLTGNEAWLLRQDQRADEWLESCCRMAWLICIAREAKNINFEHEIFGEHGLADVNRIPTNYNYTVCPSPLIFRPSASLENAHPTLRWDLSRWLLASLSNAIKWSGPKFDEKSGTNLLTKWSKEYQRHGKSPFHQTAINLDAGEHHTELTIANGFPRRYREEKKEKPDGTLSVLASIESRLPPRTQEFRLMSHAELKRYLPGEPGERVGWISTIRLNAQLFQRTIL